jgi:hypothetical protein
MERACRTCRFFEPSSTLQHGWCRNPRLYGPQHSHLVDEASIDCSRGFGDFWEPAERAGPGNDEIAAGDSVRTAANISGAASMANTQGGPDGEQAARNPRDPRSSRMSPESGGRGPFRGEPDRTTDPAEERYWTDYLRVALPVLGLLVLVGLLWYWASAIIGDNTAEAPLEPSAIALVTPVAPATPPPAAEPTVAALEPTPGMPETTAAAEAEATVAPAIIPPTIPPAEPAQPAEPTEAPAQAAADPANPCSGLPTYDSGTVIVTTDQVNLRDAPSTDGEALRVLPEGTELTVTGEFVEAGQCDWWPVSVNDTGESGYVIEQYVEAS